MRNDRAQVEKAPGEGRRGSSGLRLMQAGCGLLIALGVAGCRVEEHKGANGNAEKVNVETPLGGMHINTDAPGVAAKVGIPVYPGATEVKKDKEDSGSADVNFSFGDFRLRVLAVRFYTPDAPDKVQSFYTKQLGQYGDVIACRDHEPLTDKKRTGQGLTCEASKHSDVKTGDAGDTELKAGSPARQHIVGFEAKDGGTQFNLIYLELPHGLAGN